MLAKKEPPQEPTPTRRFADHIVEFDTVVGQEMFVQGDLSGETNAEVRGHVVGSADLQGLLMVQLTGKLKGNIKAQNVIVEGHVEGDISAAKKVELRSSSKVTGNIRAASVAMAEGCFYQGNIDMPGDGPGKPIDSFQEKRLPLQAKATANDARRR
jgi:cytoskeletal protein CcmA (bactofilin family)